VGRCVLVSFSYSDTTKLKIHEHIRKGFPAKMIEVITGRPTRVEIPAKIARRVQDLAIAKTPFSTGFRLHKQLRSLVQAHALYRGDTKVKMEDFEEVRRLSKFMNLHFHQTN
jgi:predicted metallopeptidase